MRKVLKRIKEKVKTDFTQSKAKRQRILKQCNTAADKFLKPSGGVNGKKRRKDIRPLLRQPVGE